MRKKWFLILILVILIFICILPCIILTNPSLLDPINDIIYPQSQDFNEGYYAYAIDSVSVLGELANGNVDILTPLPDKSAITPTAPDQAFQWNQQDYYAVALAVYQQAFDEALDPNWHISDIDFKAGCENLHQVPMNVSLGFFNNYQDQVTENPTIERGTKYPTTLETRMINITPINNLVEWQETRSGRFMIVNREIDLMQLKIQIEDVIRIVEENGGADIRERVNNKCSLWIGISNPEIFSNDCAPLYYYYSNSEEKFAHICWHLEYYSTEEKYSSNTLLAGTIDAETGEYEIFVPEPDESDSTVEE